MFHFKDSNNPKYNPAFGKFTRTRREVRENLKRINGETGRRFEEVGDSEPTANKVDHRVDMQDAAEHLRALTKEANRKGVK